MGLQRNKVGKAFGRVLHDVRTKKRMTQEKLGEASDFEPSYISLLEGGHRQPTITALLALEEALGLEAGDLARKTSAALRSK